MNSSETWQAVIFLKPLRWAAIGKELRLARMGGDDSSALQKGLQCCHGALPGNRDLPDMCPGDDVTFARDGDGRIRARRFQRARWVERECVADHSPD